MPNHRSINFCFLKNIKQQLQVNHTISWSNNNSSEQRVFCGSRIFPNTECNHGGKQFRLRFPEGNIIYKFPRV